MKDFDAGWSISMLVRVSPMPSEIELRIMRGYIRSSASFRHPGIDSKISKAPPLNPIKMRAIQQKFSAVLNGSARRYGVFGFRTYASTHRGTAPASAVKTNGSGPASPVEMSDNKVTTPPQIQIMARSKDGRNLQIRSYPKFETLEEERLYRKQHMAAAFRCFSDRGFDEGVAGHFSVRDPIMTDHFWLNPLSMHFSQIKVSDLILVDEDGLVVEGDDPINKAAFTIHSAIHRARPDVNAACHAHSVYGKAFSVFGRELDMITQDSLRFYKSHGVYRNFGGVVVDREEGDRIATALGNGKAAILQNHGLITVGQSIDEAAFWFISLDKTCHAQLLADAASAAGYKKMIIDDDEAEYGVKEVGGPEKGWLAFQPYFDEQLAKTGGAFLE